MEMEKQSHLFSKILCVVVLVMFSRYSFAQEKECVKLPWQIDTYIKKEAYREWGDELCRSRQILRGDLDNDKKNEFVVLYNIGGACGSNKEWRRFAAGTCGNHGESYLVIFIKKNKDWIKVAQARVGGNRVGRVELETIDNGTIQATRYEFQYPDADCCPSKQRKTSFKLKDGNIIEP